MNKTKKLLMSLVIAVLVSLGTTVYAANVMEDQNGALDVQTWKGKHVGSVRYFVVDPPHDAVFLIVYYEEGNKEIAVPVRAFSSFDQETRILILKISESQLALAPEFHDSDLDNPAFTENAYRSFGLVPAWREEEKGPERGM